MPVPQENLLVAAGKPVLENGARCESSELCTGRSTIALLPLRLKVLA